MEGRPAETETTTEHGILADPAPFVLVDGQFLLRDCQKGDLVDDLKNVSCNVAIDVCAIGSSTLSCCRASARTIRASIVAKSPTPSSARPLGDDCMPQATDEHVDWLAP